MAERPRGGPVRHDVGELAARPSCLGQRVATAGLASCAAAPGATRWVALGMTVVVVADALQHADSALEGTDG